MTNHVIDNSLKNLGKTVLWQYDKAVRLLSVIKHMHVLYHCAVEQFWNWWRTKVLSIDSCGAFGNSVWGTFLGVPNPTIIDPDTGVERFVTQSVYRKLLKGAFYLMKANSSLSSILGYLEIVFGVDGKNNLTKWSSYVSEYGWTTNVDELNFSYQADRSYSEGYVFWYDTKGDGIGNNWKCKQDIKANQEYKIATTYKTGDVVWHRDENRIVKYYVFISDVSYSENVSFESITDKIEETEEIVNTSFETLFKANLIEKTQEVPTGSDSDGTRFFKLFDPEGIVRKITGNNSDSLSMEITYEFGDTTITAKATRKRKCGVTIHDNEDMSFEYMKTPYFDEMLRDQKYLYEQKLLDICPHPLGVLTNEPVEEFIFGFEGQEPPSEKEYKAFIAYQKGSVFWYWDRTGTGEAFYWRAKEDISSSTNVSFNSISKYIEKTAKYEDGKPVDPFISGIVDTEPFDMLKPNVEEIYMDELWKRYNSSVGFGDFNYTYLPFALLKDSPFESVENGIPTEFITIDKSSNIELYVEGVVLPIQTEIWKQAIADRISDGKIALNKQPNSFYSTMGEFLKKLYGEAAANSMLSRDINYTSINRIAYGEGKMQNGQYYRAGCIVKIGNEFRYITRGGYYNDDIFEGETCPSDKTTLLEEN